MSVIPNIRQGALRYSGQFPSFASSPVPQFPSPTMRRGWNVGEKTGEILATCIKAEGPTIRYVMSQSHDPRIASLSSLLLECHCAAQI